jgi:pSer/pThr/pTyr-binding forkhead associated (FHA) protein
MAHLHLRHRKHAIELPETGETTIGRHATANITIGSFMLSRFHCTVRQQDGVLYVRDLGSKNGTWVGKRRVKDKEVAAHAGDEIRLGAIKLTVIGEGELECLSPPRLPLSGMPSEISETIRFNLDMMRSRPGDGENESNF